MQTKICTSIAQSRKLIELGIDRTTADMYWDCVVAGTMVIYEPRVITLMPHANEDAPCWSLAALLSVIPQEIFDSEYVINITEGCDKKWVITYDHINNKNHSYYGLSTGADNLVDACYNMIVELNKHNLI